MPTFRSRRFARVVCLLLFSTFLVVTSTVQVHADTIYDNGPPDLTPPPYGTPVGYSPPLFQGGWPVSNSFALLSSTSLTNAQVAIWTSSPYAPPTSIDCWIGSTAFGADLGGGLVNLTCTPVGSLSNEQQLYEASFTLPTALPLTAGNYWLTLTQPSTSYWNSSYWALSASPPNNAQAGIGTTIFHRKVIALSHPSPSNSTTTNNPHRFPSPLPSHSWA